MFLEVERQQNLLIPPDHPKWGYDPSLMNISTTRKSSNEHGAFIDATSGVGEGRIQDHTHHHIHRHTHSDHAMPRSMTGALNPKRSWRVSDPRLPRTGAMTSSPVVDHRTSSLAEISSQGPSEYEKERLSLPARSKNQMIRSSGYFNRKN